jgi:hypothetical protein
VSKVLRGMLAIAVLIAATAPASAMSNDVGRKRPLVVFTPGAEHPGFVLQRHLVNGNRNALSDREVVAIWVIGGGVTTEMGAGPGMSAAALRQSFRVSEGQFRALLLGRDGHVKLESGVPLTANDLFGELDRVQLKRDQTKQKVQ